MIEIEEMGCHFHWLGTSICSKHLEESISNFSFTLPFTLLLKPKFLCASISSLESLGMSRYVYSILAQSQIGSLSSSYDAFDDKEMDDIQRRLMIDDE